MCVIKGLKENENREIIKTWLITFRACTLPQQIHTQTTDLCDQCLIDRFCPTGLQSTHTTYLTPNLWTLTTTNNVQHGPVSATAIPHVKNNSLSPLRMWEQTTRLSAHSDALSMSIYWTFASRNVTLTRCEEIPNLTYESDVFQYIRGISQW